MLEDYPKEIISKAGSKIIFRPLEKEDEQRFLTFFAGIPASERWFLRRDLADPGILHEWIEELDMESILPIVAVDEKDNSIIASARLNRRPSECLNHVAYVRIIVDTAYRQQRLGTWLMLDAIKLAIRWGIEKLVVEFVADVEQNALNAARKLDFHEQAILRDYIKDQDGKYHDLVIMAKSLREDWCDF